MRYRVSRVRTGPPLGVDFTRRIKHWTEAKTSSGKWCAVVARKEEGASRRRAGWQAGMSQALFALRRSDRIWKERRRSRRTRWGQASCEHTWSRGGVRKTRRVERQSQSHGWHVKRCSDTIAAGRSGAQGAARSSSECVQGQCTDTQQYSGDARVHNQGGSRAEQEGGGKSAAGSVRRTAAVALQSR